MIGSFREQESDSHVTLRRRLLEELRVLPAPAVPAPRARSVDIPGPVGDELVAAVARDGLGVVHLDEPLTDERFLALGALLGTAMPETDPAVQPQVEHGVLLNLVSAHGHTGDVSLQPFATNALSLHTEGSGRAVQQQPRYIVLMCCHPGGDATAAQTVLVPMAAVHGQLPGGVADLLAHTRYRSTQDVPRVLRREAGRPVFSFRDFQEQTLQWEHDGERDAGDVADAFRQLLAAMYDATAASGVHWTRGTLVVLDNRYFFHGRAAGSADVLGERRHLKRLRIV